MIYVRSITCMSWRLIYQNQNGVSVLLRDLSVLSIFLTTFYYPFFCLIIEFWSTPGFFWSTPGLLWVNSGFAFEVRSINRPVIYLTTCKSRPLYIRNTHVVSDFRGLYSFDWGLLFTLHLLWVYWGLTLGLL